jgi:hypothetical protein
MMSGAVQGKQAHAMDARGGPSAVPRNEQLQLIHQCIPSPRNQNEALVILIQQLPH